MVKKTSVLFSYGPNKAFLVPDSFRATKNVFALAAKQARKDHRNEFYIFRKCKYIVYLVTS